MAERMISEYVDPVDGYTHTAGKTIEEQLRDDLQVAIYADELGLDPVQELKKIYETYEDVRLIRRVLRSSRVSHSTEHTNLESELDL
jgi:hypothetical protein